MDQMDPNGSIWFHLYTLRVTDEGSIWFLTIIQLGTPWNSFKDPWGSPDPTLRTNALLHYTSLKASKVAYSFIV